MKKFRIKESEYYKTKLWRNSGLKKVNIIKQKFEQIPGKRKWILIKKFEKIPDKRKWILIKKFEKIPDKRKCI